MKKGILILAVLGMVLMTSTAIGAEGDYVGTWMRQATYANNELVSQSPAVLVMKKDSFTSTSAPYATAGTLKVSGNIIQMVMTQSNCPGVSVPYTVNYTYTLSEKGNVMTIVTGPVKEVYHRQWVK